MQKPEARIYVVVKEWHWGITPTLYSPACDTYDFEFEGRCVTEPFNGLDVYGKVEVITLGQYSGKLPYRWASLPEVVEGYGFLIDKGEPHLPLLSLTLFCQSRALEWIYRAFLAAFTIPTSDFGIYITIEAPAEEVLGDEPPEREEWVIVAWHIGMYAERGSS